jgi:hypothetical protein
VDRPNPAAVARWIVWAMRGLATLHLALVLEQAVLAGMFVTGEVDMLARHSDNAVLTSTVMIFLLVAAILLWRPGRGPGRPALVCAGLVVAETAQIMLGQSRLLAVHIPLGVTIFGVSMALALWTWQAMRKGRS